MHCLTYGAELDNWRTTEQYGRVLQQMNDDFSKRLESAIERGKQAADQKADEARRQEQTEERLRELHSEHRLVLCEYIEKTVNQLADHFPGFRSESVYDEDGWGSACYRENLHIENGRRTTQFSRFEICLLYTSDAADE